MFDFCSQIIKLKLKKLAFQQFIDTDEDLLRLGFLIEQQRNTLESLSLKLIISGRRCYGYGSGSWFDGFFGRIKLLKSLKKLELRLIPMVFLGSLPISERLAEVVEALDGLEEIDFEDAKVDFKDGEENLGNLCKALQKHSQSLKSLKLSLNDCNPLETLIQSLKRFSKLEYLTRKPELEKIFFFCNEGLKSQ